MKRRTAENWDIIINDYRQSGLSQREYCNRHDFNYWTFRDQRIKREFEQSTSNKLVKVRTRMSVQPEQSVFEKNFCITFLNGITVEIQFSSDSAALLQVLKDLK